MLDGTKYFECVCGSSSHTLRFIVDNDEDHGDYPQMPTIYTEIMLSHFRPWYERVWIGIKYMLGMDTPDHFGCWEIKPEDTVELIKLFTDFKNKGVTKSPINNIVKRRAEWIDDGKDELYTGYEQTKKD